MPAIGIHGDLNVYSTQTENVSTVKLWVIHLVNCMTHYSQWPCSLQNGKKS